MLFLITILAACAKSPDKVWHDHEGHKVWIRAMDEEYA